MTLQIEILHDLLIKNDDIMIVKVQVCPICYLHVDASVKTSNCLQITWMVPYIHTFFESRKHSYFH